MFFPKHTESFRGNPTLNDTTDVSKNSTDKESSSCQFPDNRNNCDGRGDCASPPITNHEHQYFVTEKQIRQLSTLDQTINYERTTLKEEIRDFPKSMARLARNAVFVLYLVSSALNSLVLQGRISFSPKYMKDHFHIPLSKANLMLGIVAVVGPTFGSLLGGVLVSVCKMTVRSCLVCIIAALMVSHVLLMANVTMVCDDVQTQNFSDYAVSDDLTSITRRSSVNCSDKLCQCADRHFLPVCGQNGLNYYSPCHAGCTVRTGPNTFSNCSCIKYNGTSRLNGVINDSVSTAGFCASGCRHLIPYVVTLFVATFSFTVAIIPGAFTVLRIVEERDRTLAIGILNFVMTLFGTCLSPIIYGAMIDTSCKLWEGSCRLYDMGDFRIKYHLYIGWLGLLSPIFNIIALILVSYHKTYIALVKETSDNNDKKGQSTTNPRLNKPGTSIPNGKTNMAFDQPVEEYNTRL